MGLETAPQLEQTEALQKKGRTSGSASPEDAVQDAGSTASPEGPEATTSPEKQKGLESAAETDSEAIDTKTELVRIEGSIEAKQREIERLATSIENDKSGLDDVRARLGIGGAQESDRSADREKLEQLKTEQQELAEQKEEMEAADELNKVLESMSQLPPDEIKIIIETGKNGKGESLTGPNGEKVSPDVAKELGKLVEKGVTKITKAVLSAIVGIVKGVIKGIFEVVKATAEALKG